MSAKFSERLMNQWFKSQDGCPSEEGLKRPSPLLVQVGAGSILEIVCMSSAWMEAMVPGDPLTELIYSLV